MDRDDIVNQVEMNCARADSRHAGLYSICGLALRLRDLYKWEKRLDPWVEAESAELLQWIGAKEEEWEGLVEDEFARIAVSGKTYDPFDVDGINDVLLPRGLYYGAGYVHNLRPSFFLAVLDEKRQINGHSVYMLGRELARDLVTLPALTQGNAILIRKESARLHLWDRIFFIRKSGREALNVALQAYGVDPGDHDALHRNLDRISAAETETYIHHELGEIRETGLDRNTWRDIVATYPHTPIELLARTVKDLLADTNEHGRLRHIRREKKKGSLALYVAFLDGLAKLLFPELPEAFRRFSEADDWKMIDRAVSKGFKRAGSYAEKLSRIHREGKKREDTSWAEQEIGRELLAPLGIQKEPDQAGDQA